MENEKKLLNEAAESELSIDNLDDVAGGVFVKGEETMPDPLASRTKALEKPLKPETKFSSKVDP